MKLARYLALATTPFAALSIFNIYRRSFGVSLNDWMAGIAEETSRIVTGIVDAPAQNLLGWDPPQLLSDMWIFSLWWTGVMASATVGAMKDKGDPTPWSSQLVMLPIRLFLGYSLIGFFWAATVIPITFAKFKTGDDDLDRYGHWIRVFTLTCAFIVAALFMLNSVSL